MKRFIKKQQTIHARYIVAERKKGETQVYYISTHCIMYNNTLYIYI